MSNLRKAAQQGLEALEDPWKAGAEGVADAIIALRAALAEPVCNCDMRTRLVGDGCEVCNPERAQDLAEPVQVPLDPDITKIVNDNLWNLYVEEPAEPVQEPVAHSVIAGALFDFMGWLTSRRKRIVLSSADNASPAVEAITEFAKMRGLSLDDAKVQDWNTAPTQRKPLTDEEIWSNDEVMECNAHIGSQMNELIRLVRAVERTHGIR